MATPNLTIITTLSLLLLLSVSLPRSESSLSQNPSLLLLADGFDWPTFEETFDNETELAQEQEEDDDDVKEGGLDRRSLYWRRRKYYISYGALSANRIPCPPRSGRSYYTHNCFRARGPVHPYSRGCSSITRCRR